MNTKAMPHKETPGRSQVSLSPSGGLTHSDRSGGTHKGTIVFSHGNSFPAGTYRLLFQAWREAGYSVQAVEKFGHNPHFPVTNNWPHLRDELIDFIERETQTPVILVGHSLGGLLSLMVACRRPHLVSSLVMLDSPVLMGWRADGLRMIKNAGLVGIVSPGRISKNRRHEWPTREDVLRHYATKRVFRRWDPRVFADYIQAGVQTLPNGRVTLAFRREVETLIYNTMPHDFSDVLKAHPPRCPVGFIAGKRSRELRQVGTAASHALARNNYMEIDGTHLYPMEHPEATAKTVLHMIEGLEKDRAPLV